MFLPAQDFEFYQFFSSKKTIGNQSTILQGLQNSKHLMLKPGGEPFCQLACPAQPFAGIYGIANTVYALVWRAEICIAAKDGIIKKAGAAANADIMILKQKHNELAVDPAAWIIHDLLDF